MNIMTTLKKPTPEREGFVPQERAITMRTADVTEWMALQPLSPPPPRRDREALLPAPRWGLSGLGRLGASARPGPSQAGALATATVWGLSGLCSGAPRPPLPWQACLRRAPRAGPRVPGRGAGPPGHGAGGEVAPQTGRHGLVEAAAPLQACSRPVLPDVRVRPVQREALCARLRAGAAVGRGRPGAREQTAAGQRRQ